MNKNKTNIVEARENLATIKDQMEEVKALSAILTIKDDEYACYMPKFRDMVTTRYNQIIALLDKQEETLRSIECAFAVEELKEEGKKADDVEPIEVLGLSDAIVSLLKREASIYTVKDLMHYRRKDDLTAIHGCGRSKADKIEAALSRYVDKKNASTVDAEVLGW